MKRPGSILLAVLFVTALFVAGPLAHGNNDHVRGVVTEVSAESVTVQLQDQTTSTLKVTAQTTVEKSGKAVQLTDLKVGERVVVDVPKGTKEARLIRFGPPPAKTAATATTAQKSPSGEKK